MSARDLPDLIREACAELGLVYQSVPADGRWRAVDVDGERSGTGNGRLKVFPDGQGVVAWNWRSGESVTRFLRDDRALSAEQRAERARLAAEQQRIAAERQVEVRAEAAQKAAELWQAASPDLAGNPYLSRKGVAGVDTLRTLDADRAAEILGYAPRARGEYLAGELLVAPVKVGGKLTTVELIDGAGRKSAVAGGVKGGGYWSCGRLPDPDEPGQSIILCEGVATALSLHEATPGHAVAALSCGNLKKVACELRKRYPQAELIVAGDLGNGAEHAAEAARAAGAALVFPDFGPERGDHETDFNDLAARFGVDVVREQVGRARRMPTEAQEPTPEPLPPDALPEPPEAWSEPSSQWVRAADQPRPEWLAPAPLHAEIEPEPYPWDALPETIRDAVSEAQEFSGAPWPLVACSALCAVSVAVQALVDVSRGEGLTGPTGLFLNVVAESGERKSTVDRLFMAPVRDFEQVQRDAMRVELQRHEAARSAWEAERDGLTAAIKECSRNDAKGRKGSGKTLEQLRAELEELQRAEPLPPRVPRLLQGDSTPEALAWSLAKHWPSAGIVSAEAGAVFGSHGMGRDSIMRALALLNTLWDGGVHAVARRTSEAFTVAGARLTVGLQVQPETLREFFRVNGPLARGSGFLARFLLACPASTQGTRLFRDPPANMPGFSRFRERLAEILAMPVPMDDTGRLRPAVMPLSQVARDAWVRFYNAVEVELGERGELHEVRDVASKSAENAARLAALFEVFEVGASGEVSQESMEAACRIVAWHLHESRRFFGELALPPDLADAARLDRWLVAECARRGATGMSRREVQRAGPVRDARRLQAALEVLSDLWRCRVETEGRQKLIRLNPELLAGTDRQEGTS